MIKLIKGLRLKFEMWRFTRLIASIIREEIKAGRAKEVEEFRVWLESVRDGREVPK